MHLYLMNIWQQSVLVLDLQRYLLNSMISLLPQPVAIMMFNDQKHSRWLLCSYPAPSPSTACCLTLETFLAFHQIWNPGYLSAQRCYCQPLLGSKPFRCSLPYAYLTLTVPQSSCLAVSQLPVTMSVSTTPANLHQRVKFFPLPAQCQVLGLTCCGVCWNRISG